MLNDAFRSTARCSEVIDLKHDTISIKSPGYDHKNKMYGTYETCNWWIKVSIGAHESLPVVNIKYDTFI